MGEDDIRRVVEQMMDDRARRLDAAGDSSRVPDGMDGQVRRTSEEFVADMALVMRLGMEITEARHRLGRFRDLIATSAMEAEGKRSGASADAEPMIGLIDRLLAVASWHDEQEAE